MINQINESESGIHKMAQLEKTVKHIAPLKTTQGAERLDKNRKK